MARGFYASRTDFIRAAIRVLHNNHTEEMQRDSEYRAFALGVLVYTRKDLEELQRAGQQKDLMIIGVLVFPDDITPELARAAIHSIKVYGVFRASLTVKEALADRIR